MNYERPKLDGSNDSVNREPAKEVYKEITARRINPENEREISRLMQLEDSPEVNRHVIPYDDDEDEELAAMSRTERAKVRVRDESMYGVYGIGANNQEDLLTVAYLYPYSEYEPDEPEEESESEGEETYESETVQQMIEMGIIDENRMIVPRTPNGEIDYSRTHEISIFTPGDVSREHTARGLRSAMDLYRREHQLADDTLFFAFQLRNAADTVEGIPEGLNEEQKAEYLALFNSELEQEAEILRSAGLQERGQIEKGNVGVFIAGKAKPEEKPQI